MKKKRFFVIALLVFCMASAVTVCAGVKASYLESKYLDMELYGRISFLEKPCWLQDVISYKAALTGTDFDLIVEGKDKYQVYVTPSSNKKSFNSIYLTEEVKTIERNSRKCGFNCTFGKLEMVCFTDKCELVSFDND